MSIHVIRELRSHGHEAYWVGGSVRDRLLGRSVWDWDVATSARPEEVQRIFDGSRVQGVRFGVCGVKDGDRIVHVATFRSEGRYSDGRRPDSVTYTTDPKADVRRRDFTINGMLFDPVKDEVLDFVGGQRDLDQKLVRTIGDPRQRFSEDWLRMLRAVRFAAALGFSIESKTKGAIQALASNIDGVASERVRDELSRILMEGGARRGFELLDETGLLAELLPEVTELKGVEQPPNFHPEGDVWTHTLLMLEGLEEPSLALAWGVLLHDIGKPLTFRRTDRIRFHGHVEKGIELAEGICARLRFSNAETERILALIRNHMKMAVLPRMRPGKQRRFVEQPHFDEHLELHRLDCVASHGRLGKYRFAVEKSKEVAACEPVVPLLTGHDLMEAGYTPGPVFKEILGLVEELHLDGELGDRESALGLVRERFPLAPRSGSTTMSSRH